MSWRTIGGMTLLTYRELWAKKIIVGLFVVSTMVWLMLAAALNLDIVEGSIAGIRIFGIEGDATNTRVDPETGARVAEALSLETVVVAVESFVAGATYWLAALLGLFATAPMLPSLLADGRVDLLLSKPLSRTQILGGHFAGIVSAALALTGYLIVSVWLVMSLKTGIWNPRFLLTVGVVVIMFAVMYSVIAFLSVTTRSTALSLTVTYGLLFASLILWAKDTLAPQIGLPWRHLFVACYHVLPNFSEVTSIASKLAGPDPVSSWYPLVSSAAFGLVVGAATFILFSRRDF